jgi:hypothetical protein
VIVKESMRKEKYHAAFMDMLSRQCLDLFDLRSLNTNEDKHRERIEGALWHPTRIFEYPWVLNVAFPEGKVLDLGSNEQFALTLLQGGMCKDMTVHHTHTDSAHTGIIETGLGFLPMYRPRERHKEDFTMFWGLPKQMEWEDRFDVIYNISIMEHVEAENVKDWFTYPWRALKPGGKMAVTIDYLPEKPMGFRSERIGIQNHDLSFCLENGAILEHAETKELPWHPDFDKTLFEDGDARVVDFSWRGSEPEKLAVYGFVLRKPE